MNWNDDLMLDRGSSVWLVKAIYKSANIKTVCIAYTTTPHTAQSE
jgi:hypothetical protein